MDTVIAVVGLFAVLTVLLLPVALYVERRERRYRAAVGQGRVRQGFLPVPDVRSVFERVRELLELSGEPVDDRSGLAFALHVGGRDGFYVDWACSVPSPGEGPSWLVVHAYIVLAPGPPRLHVGPKGVFGKPADRIDFPKDPRFSKAFWVQGQDEGACRRFLGPELRQFLLAMNAREPWALNVGPEGVVLLRGPVWWDQTRQPQGGRTPTAEVSQLRKNLERLMAATEPGHQQT